MAAALGTPTTASMNNAGTTTTYAFTSTNQPLYVVIGVWRAAKTINTVTYGGTALTRVAQTTPSNGDDLCEIWRLLNPTAGTANVVITGSGTNLSGTTMAVNTTGQDTGGTPEGSSFTNSSTVNGTSTGNLAITGAVSGDVTLVVIADGSATAITPGSTGGAGMAELFDLASNGEETEAFKVFDAVTQVSGGSFTSAGWAIAAIVLKGVALAREQEGYRFRNDDGSESTATWKAAQDTDVTGLAKATPLRLRVLTNVTSDPPSEALKLQWRKVGEPHWNDIA